MARGTSFDKFALCRRTADLIWTRSTTFDTGKRWERGCVDLARAKKRDEIASRTETGNPIETGKSAFDSSLREEDDKPGDASLFIR